MKPAKLVLVLAMVLVCSSSVLTQTAPNHENGWKPYGSYDGSHLDTVNLMNGNLMLHAPLVPSSPQRGSLALSQTLFASAKDWQAVCKSSVAGYTACSWQNGGMKVTTQIAPGLTVHRTLNKQYTTAEGLTTYAAYGYSLTTVDGATHNLHGVPGTEDSTGEATKFDSIDLSGYHLELSDPDTHGIRNTFTVIDRQGNVYQGSISQTAPCGRAQTNQLPNIGHLPMIDDSPMGDQYCSQTGFASGVTDSNGNHMDLRLPQGVTPLDTLGRPLQLMVSGSAIDPNDSSGCVSGHPFYAASVLYYNAPDGTTRPIKTCVSTITVHTAFGQSAYGQPIAEYDSTNPVNPPATAVTTIILADGTKWTFDYDNYGELTYVGLPTGGSIIYTWTSIGFANCDFITTTPVSRAVAARTLNDAQGHTYQWIYTWGAATSTGLTNVVKDPLGNETVHVFSSMVPAGSTTAPGCNLYETSAIQYQGLQSANHPLQRVDTTYSSLYFAEDLFGTGAAVGNVFATDVVTTICPSGKVRKMHRDPDLGLGAGLPIFGNVKKEFEYDWGQGALPGALLRETDTTYQWEVNSAYLTAHLLDLPASVIVKDGSGNRVAETDYTYDEANYLTTPNPTVATQHNATPPYVVRGNQSTVSRWLNTTNSFISSHTNWYDTGEVNQQIDPLGHATIYSYDPFYKGAYITQTCSPQTTVAHCVSGTYDFSTGMLTSLTNENATAQASGNRAGDSAHTSNYSYDSMFRIASAQAPPDPANSNARAQTGFNFSAPNVFPITVQHTKSVTTALTDSATTTLDGLARAYKTQHVLPNGTAMIDTTFDAAGRAATVSNPYFTTSDPTYGITSNQYDALDRVTQTTKQDGSIGSVKYNIAISVPGNCTETTDEAGKQRRTCADALGRLVEVDEPAPGGAPLQNNHALMQTDGNLVLYTPGNTALWSTGTAGTGAGGFEVQDNGDVVLYIEKWQAGTYVTPSPGPFMAQSCNIGWAMYAPQTLSPGQCLVSPRGQYRLGMETDGNLVLYNLVNNVYTVTWNSATYNHPGAYAVMQTDGNFVVYSTGGVALWSSGTASTNSQRLELWDDGRFIIFRSAWNAGTAQGWWAGSMSHPGCDLGIGTGGGGWMGTGQCFVSPNGRYELLLQTDGNLVLYDRSPTPAVALWSTGTAVTAMSPGIAMQTLYTYDALGNLTCVEQHGDATSGTGCSSSPSNDATSPWRVRRFTYDSLSRLLTAKNPESGTITYLYDADGELLMKTSPAPNQTDSATQTISYCYDELHRPTKRDYSAHTFSPPACPIIAPIVSYAYDSGDNAKGHLTSILDQAGTATYGYDILGRLTSETRSIAGVSKSTGYAYNLGGSVKTLTYPSGRVVTYAPDSAGKLVSAVDGNGTSYVSSASYNPDGSLKGLLNGSTPALNQSFQYNPRLQLCRITTLTSGTLPTSCTDSQHIGNVMDRGYDFHAGNGAAGSGVDNGNVYTITNYRDANRSQAFSYDALNRLTAGWSSANTGAYSWGENYSIDAWGNLQISPMGGKAHGSNFQLSGNVQNRPTGLAYDAAGNLMSYLSATYIYDQENRLSSTAGMAYTYDGKGERVLKSQANNGAALKRFWSMGGNTLAEDNGAGTLTAEYIYFGSKRVARIDLLANTVHYYLSDHLGSTSIVASASGTVEEESDYYPFGTEVVVTGPGVNELKFTGKRRDTESQLDYFGARHYSNLVGRFLTVDPLGILKQKLLDPQQWNMLSYVRQSPLRFIDPDGRAVRLSDDEKERARQLAAAQKSVGKDAGKYLYDNTAKDGHHYLGILKGGPDGKGPDFNKINPAANKLSGIIQDARVATLQFVQPGFVTPRGTVIDEIGSGSPAATPPGQDSVTIYITSGSLGTFPGVMSSDGLDRDANLADILSHEIGHLDSNWFHGGVDSQGDSVRMENETRKLNGEPLRLGHNKPGDVVLTGAPY